MGFAIHPWDQVHYRGNSITVGAGWNEGDFPWHANPGGLDAQITTGLTTNGTAAASGAVRSASGAAGSGNAVAAITFTSFGGAGTDWRTPNTNFSTYFGTIPPATITPSPVIVLEWGINDAFNISQSTQTLAQMETAFTGVLTQILSSWPSARIAVLSCLAFNEQYNAGPPASWGPNSIDTQIASVDTQLQTILAAQVPSGQRAYIDNRTALLAWEVINNPTDLASVGLEPNGAGGAAVHPKEVVMTAVMAPTFLAAVPVTP